MPFAGDHMEELSQHLKGKNTVSLHERVDKNSGTPRSTKAWGMVSL